VIRLSEGLFLEALEKLLRIGRIGVDYLGYAQA
jgi:hypothetical protein